MKNQQPYIPPEFGDPPSASWGRVLAVWTIIICACIVFAILGYQEVYGAVLEDMDVRTDAPSYFVLDIDPNQDNGIRDAIFSLSPAWKPVGWHKYSDIWPDLWLAPQLTGHWKLSEESQPIDEAQGIDYTPRAYLSWGSGAWWNFISEVQFGYQHRSNGKVEPLSVSVDQFFVKAVLSVQIATGERFTVQPAIYRIWRADGDVDTYRETLGDASIYAAYEAEWGVVGITENLAQHQTGLVTSTQYHLALKIPQMWLNTYVYGQYFHGYAERLTYYDHVTDKGYIGLMLAF